MHKYRAGGDITVNHNYHCQGTILTIEEQYLIKLLRRKGELFLQEVIASIISDDQKRIEVPADFSARCLLTNSGERS